MQALLYLVLEHLSVNTFPLPLNKKCQFKQIDIFYVWWRRWIYPKESDFCNLGWLGRVGGDLGVRISSVKKKGRQQQLCVGFCVQQGKRSVFGKIIGFTSLHHIYHYCYYCHSIWLHPLWPFVFICLKTCKCLCKLKYDMGTCLVLFS